jgi:hypothetical protein
LIVFGRTVGSGQRWALIGFTAFAAATHSATLALVIILGCLMALLPRLVSLPRAGHALLMGEEMRAIVLGSLLGVIRLFRDGMKVPTAAGTVLPRR